MAARQRVSMLRNLTSAIRIATRPGSPSLSVRAAALPRLVRATASGEYQGTSVLRLLALGGAAAYIVSPVDLVPEGLFGVFGLADDAMVAGWLAANLVTETEDFIAWEQARAGAQDGRSPDGAGSARPEGGTAATGSERSTVPGHVVR